MMERADEHDEVRRTVDAGMHRDEFMDDAGRMWLVADPPGRGSAG